MALKIKLVNDDGKGAHVHPETMELMMSFGQHRQFCEECELASKYPWVSPCSLGAEILKKLLDRPDVEQVPD